ncbi:MAG: type II toxin-antitoxin system VapC family toxin [Ignavibacteriae bacterium]|nr:type II toxin-antitoxin system VapC family toxin [Ignavibacteriota bacterium]
MLKPKVYIETSVISYLTANPSRDLIVASNQRITQEWWKHSKKQFDCYISQFVISELSQGDKSASSKRTGMLHDLNLLEHTKEVENLAVAFYKLLGIPEKSRIDAFHLAITVYYKIDFLLSWNCNILLTQ